MSSLLGSASQFTPAVVQNTVYSNHCSVHLTANSMFISVSLKPGSRLGPDHLQVYKLDGATFSVFAETWYHVKTIHRPEKGAMSWEGIHFLDTQTLNPPFP